MNLSFADGELLEGVESTITATLRNDGTAMARKVSVELVCDGVEVKEPALLETEYPSTERVFDLEWEVTIDELDWWTQSSDVSCEVVLTKFNWADDENTTSKTFRLDGEVESWSPNIGIIFIATLGLIVLSVVLLRLVGQNDKFRLAATYSGVLSLGFAFHLMNLTGKFHLSLFGHDFGLNYDMEPVWNSS